MNNNRLLSPRPPPVATKQTKAKTSEKTKKGAAKREISPNSPTPDSNAVKNGDSPHARRKTVVQKLRTPEDSAKALSSSPEGREVSQLKSPRDNGKEKIGTVRGATLVSDDEE